MATARRSEQTAPKITPKQQKFVDEYLKDLNATQAAIRAGYSKKTAKQQATRLLTNVYIAASLSVARDKQQIRTGISADRALQEAARLAFFDVRKLCDAQGNPKPIHELDDDTAAAIQGLELSSEQDGETSTTVRKYKIADKNAALERVFKHLGLFERDNDQANNPLKAMAALMTLVSGSKLPISTSRK
jgi:phage terminase small subunit